MEDEDLKMVSSYLVVLLRQESLLLTSYGEVFEQTSKPKY